MCSRCFRCPTTYDLGSRMVLQELLARGYRIVLGAGAVAKILEAKPSRQATETRSKENIRGKNRGLAFDRYNCERNLALRRNENII